MNWAWLKRRWFEFRMGHGTYLSLLLGFTNFLLITYNFLIDRVSALKTLFPSLLIFMWVGAAIYIPLTILVGHFHNKKQLKTDVMFAATENPYFLDTQKRLARIEKLLEEK